MRLCRALRVFGSCLCLSLEGLGLGFRMASECYDCWLCSDLGFADVSRGLSKDLRSSHWSSGGA